MTPLQAIQYDLVLASTQVDADCLGLCITRQRRLSKLATDTRFFKSTERKGVVKSVVGVNPYGSGFQAIRDIDGSDEVCGVKSSSKTVIGVVSNSDSVIGGLELCDRSDGPEDLFLHNLHVLPDTREKGRLDKVAFSSMARSTSFNCGALLLSVVDVRHDPVKLKLGHLGSLESVWMEGVANYVLRDPLLERRNKLFDIVNTGSEKIWVGKLTLS